MSQTVQPTASGSERTDLDPESLRAGDIVFIRIDNFLYRRVAASTRSWISHVGILYDRLPDGEWRVAESAVPRCRLTTLSRFLKRSKNGHFSIKRLEGVWNGETLAKLRTAIDQRLGLWYDLGFNQRHARRQYCSKFVAEVVDEATGVRLGNEESFRELRERNPDYPVWFWYLWFFGRIPWSRVTLSPGSLYQAPELVLVGEGFLKS